MNRNTKLIQVLLKAYSIKSIFGLMLTVQLNSSPLSNDKLTETSTIIAPEGIKSNVTRKENLLLYFPREKFQLASTTSLCQTAAHSIFHEAKLLNWDNIFCLVEIKNYNLAIFVLFSILNLSKYLQKCGFLSV